MAVAIFTSRAPSEDQRGRLFDPVLAVLRAYRQREADRRALRYARHLDARLRADMGLGETSPAIVGDWDNLGRNPYLIRPIG